MPVFTFNIFSKEIQNRVVRKDVAKNKVLFQQGAIADSVYFVEEGCVRLVVYPQDGKQMVLCRARNGEPFAEEHLTRETYSYTAIADLDSVLQSVPKQDLLDDVCRHPDVAKRYIKCLSERYHQLRINFERLGISSARDRVFNFFATFVQSQSNQIDLSGKLKSLSDDLNLSHEAVYRALHELESDGLIHREGGIITFLK